MCGCAAYCICCARTRGCRPTWSGRSARCSRTTPGTAPTSPKPWPSTSSTAATSRPLPRPPICPGPRSTSGCAGSSGSSAWTWTRWSPGSPCTSRCWPWNPSAPTSASGAGAGYCRRSGAGAGYCRRSAVDVVHHVLDPGVLLQRVQRQVLAVTGVLEAAVRHLGHDRDVHVHPHATEVQPLGHPHRAPVIAGPHRRRAPALDSVCPFQGRVLVAERLHGDDRAEHLVLDDFVGLAQVGDHGRGVEVAVLADPVAADGQ